MRTTSQAGSITHCKATVGRERRNEDILVQKLPQNHFRPASLLVLEVCHIQHNFARGAPFFCHHP